MDERRILLINDKDEIVVGYAKFFPDWFETWKKGGEGAIFEILFDEGKTPDMLVPRQIQELYDEGIERFKDKMGITPEDY